ncbi:hypothetical protein SCP_0110710 [Sparassis crispa]|uniref:Uncharacterized protein n=1 Tax=Sparassis crispa TaxID=139825 RepID=A0A401G7R3_9APHY|nr:hypothetical protein SCP_0110710 [Sparassis crispa]GBE78188.1 hypothetical protein SCP_0110710 [Sparassis crispa]
MMHCLIKILSSLSCEYDAAKRPLTGLLPERGWSFVRSPSISDGVYAFAGGFGEEVQVVLPANTISVYYLTFKQRGGALYVACLDNEGAGTRFMGVDVHQPNVDDDQVLSVLLCFANLSPTIRHTLTVVNLQNLDFEGISQITFYSLIVTVLDDVGTSSIASIRLTSVPASTSSVGTTGTSMAPTSTVLGPRNSAPTSSGASTGPHTSVLVSGTSSPSASGTASCAPSLSPSSASATLGSAQPISSGITSSLPLSTTAPTSWSGTGTVFGPTSRSRNSSSRSTAPCEPTSSASIASGIPRSTVSGMSLSGTLSSVQPTGSASATSVSSSGASVTPQATSSSSVPVSISVPASTSSGAPTLNPCASLSLSRVSSSPAAGSYPVSRTGAASLSSAPVTSAECSTVSSSWQAASSSKPGLTISSPSPFTASFISSPGISSSPIISSSFNITRAPPVSSLSSAPRTPPPASSSSPSPTATPTSGLSTPLVVVVSVLSGFAVLSLLFGVVVLLLRARRRQMRADIESPRGLGLIKEVSAPYVVADPMPSRPRNPYEDSVAPTIPLDYPGSHLPPQSPPPVPPRSPLQQTWTGGRTSVWVAGIPRTAPP